MFAQPLFLHRSWRWRPRPDRRLLLILLGVSAGGGGDKSRPGTLGALLGDCRSADEAGTEVLSGLESLNVRSLKLGGEDLRTEIFRFLTILTFFFFFFSSDGAAFKGADSITSWVFLVPLGSFLTSQDDILRRELSLLTFRFLLLKDSFLRLTDNNGNLVTKFSSYLDLLTIG